MYITIKLHSDINPYKKGSKVIERIERLDNIPEDSQVKAIGLDFLLMKEKYENEEFDFSGLEEEKDGE